MTKITVEEAAQRWGKNRSTIERWIAAGLPVSHHGKRGRRLIESEELDTFAMSVARRTLTTRQQPEDVADHLRKKHAVP